MWRSIWISFSLKYHNMITNKFIAFYSVVYAKHLRANCYFVCLSIVRKTVLSCPLPNSF